MQFLDALQSLQLPDAWQAEAIRSLKDGSDVVLDAPTGAGKTYVLEQLIEESGGRRSVFYAAPTRALANDKYFEWLQRKWPVGLVTGDISRNPNAQILVGTLEALYGRLRSTGKKPHLCAIDEYQWLSDRARGNHYEGFVLSTPPESQLLFMSGSVSNPGELAAWLTSLGRRSLVVQHKIRPVPLEEFDVEGPSRKMPDSLQGFWTRRVAAALSNDLGPVLVFAPHRKEAERLARQMARELPPPQRDLELTNAQQHAVDAGLARLLQTRVAYHHSGLEYPSRAGVIEPLAKNGQLRVVVSTLGLGSGINFSLRSVLITAREYRVGGISHVIGSDELLQMMGRAGRRGLDDRGYFLVGRGTPRMSEARTAPLKRMPPLPWQWMLQTAGCSEEASMPERWKTISGKLFASDKVTLGIGAVSRPETGWPCQLDLDTARARLVRRRRRPAKICRKCPHRKECIALDPRPTPLWQWWKLGLVDSHLTLTPRGRVVSQFLGPEGLALAAGLEDPSYPVSELILDLADCHGGERFCEGESRWSGRLAHACRRIYRRFSIEGWLDWGVPLSYGFGGAEILRKLLNKEKRKGQLISEFSGAGDIDRLLVEWTSLLRQIHLADWETERGLALKDQAEAWLRLFPCPEVPAFPPMTSAQITPISHRLSWRRKFET